MPRNTIWITGTTAAALIGLSFALNIHPTLGQALPPIADPPPHSNQSLFPNLFEQEQSTVRIANAQDQAAPRTSASLPSAPLRGSTQPKSPTNSAQTATPIQTVSGITSLAQAGVVIDNGNPNRMVVERVLPNSAAFRAGLLPGDVITGVTIGLQIDRNGQTGQLVLNPVEPAVRTAMRPIMTGVPIGPPETAAARGVDQGSASVTGSGVSGSGTAPQGPGTPGLGSAPPEGGGSAAMRAGHSTPSITGPGIAVPPRNK